MVGDLGLSFSEQIVKSALLDGLINKLKNDGWNIEMTQSDSGYTIIFGRPGEPQNTAYGEKVIDVFDDLIRNLTQMGEIPKELREMQLQIQRQVRPVQEAVQQQLAHDIRLALGESES